MMKEVKGSTKRTQEQEKVMKIQKEDIMDQVKGNTKRGQEQEKLMEVQEMDIMKKRKDSTKREHEQKKVMEVDTMQQERDNTKWKWKFEQGQEKVTEIQEVGTIGERKYLVMKTGDIFFPYRVKVHLSSDSKMSMFTDLLGRGFRIDDPAQDPDPDHIFANNIAFEIHAIPREHEKYLNAVTLVQDYFVNTSGCIDVIDATMILNLGCELSRDFDICPQPLGVSTVFCLHEILKEKGCQDIADSIKNQNPVIAYMTDEEEQVLYFHNPANMYKTVGGFIAHIRKTLKKEGIRKGVNKEKINIKISKTWQFTLDEAWSIINHIE